MTVAMTINKCQGNTVGGAIQPKTRKTITKRWSQPAILAKPSEKLIEVVDQCRLAGAADVGVATEQEAG